MLLLLHLLLLGPGPGLTTDQPAATSHLPPVTCSREHISSSLRASSPCIIRDKVVEIPRPSNTSVDQLTPSHVTVKRCSGGCHGQSSCVAASTATRKVPVLLARCPLGGGKCEKECASVEVEDHLSCTCGCRVQEDECRGDQAFSSSTCSCTCRDRQASTR